MFEKGAVSESKYSCDPTAGTSPDPIFVLPEGSVKPELRKDRAPHHGRESPLAAWSPTPQKPKLERFRRTSASLRPRGTNRGSRSTRRGQPQRNTLVPATRKDARPARSPARPSRPLPEAGPLPAPPRPAGSKGRSRVPRIPALQSRGFPGPLPASQRRSVPARWHRRLTRTPCAVPSSSGARRRSSVHSAIRCMTAL